MRNLRRISNHYNRIEAWKDWRKLADKAIAKGHKQAVAELWPAEDASWKKIDASIARLREKMGEVKK